MFEVERSRRVGFMYGGVFVAMIFLNIYFSGLIMMVEEGIWVGLIMLIMTVTTFLVFLDYLQTPQKPIIVTEEGNVLIPRRDLILSCEEVTDVSCIRARAKGIEYKWGKVVIHTETDTYKINYIDDCEETAEHLLEKIYAFKMKDY